ncbi:hypothetical protein EJC47_18455 [Sphingomonas sp. TF3]|uniref:hypothetical protein n=1 Tax=Sphingomonas sp. TF3 TaxID=2495580 RepID=UPI000F88A33C|nr:hypothetical protein [Sphingomonas sp. TF3]RUN75055.1 hypothetical protein EJC47_18455 [Sphingomonas sp. TF3]
MTPIDLLEDAQLLYGRAQDHIGAFNRLNASLWQLKHGRLPDGTFTGTLVLDRAVLRAMKPVISDIANNLIHALDHVAAAVSRAASSGRPRNLYFPIAPDDAAYEVKRKPLEKLLDPQWLDLFAAVREAHKSYQGYLWLLKEISNSGKHWELIAGGASALALAWNPPGERQQSIVEIPRDHFAANDHFNFWKGADPVPALPFQIITQHRFEGLDGGADASADSVFSTCSRFVADVIAESRQRLDGAAGS